MILVEECQGAETQISQDTVPANLCWPGYQGKQKLTEGVSRKHVAARNNCYHCPLKFPGQKSHRPGDVTEEKQEKKMSLHDL